MFLTCKIIPKDLNELIFNLIPDYNLTSENSVYKRRTKVPGSLNFFGDKIGVHEFASQTRLTFSGAFFL